MFEPETTSRTSSNVYPDKKNTRLRKKSPFFICDRVSDIYWLTKWSIKKIMASVRYLFLLRTAAIIMSLQGSTLGSGPPGKRLYYELISRRNYNKLLRPLGTHAGRLSVKLGMRLSQLLDVVSNHNLSLLIRFLAVVICLPASLQSF